MFLLVPFFFLFLQGFYFQQQSGETPPPVSMLNMTSALICSGFFFHLLILSSNIFLISTGIIFLFHSFISVKISNILRLIFLIFAEELFDMQVFMLIWEELLVEEMILNLLHILSFFFIKAGYHGKVIRCLHLFFSSSIYCGDWFPLHVCFNLFLISLTGR